jgi:hypothetical protein
MNLRAARAYSGPWRVHSPQPDPTPAHDAPGEPRRDARCRNERSFSGMYFYGFRDVVMAARFFHSADISELEEALTFDARQCDAEAAVPSHASTAQGQPRRVVSWRNPSATTQTAVQIQTVVHGQELAGCEARDGGTKSPCRRRPAPETHSPCAGASARRAKETLTIGATEPRHPVQGSAFDLKAQRIASRKLALHKRSHRGAEHMKTSAMVRPKALKCTGLPSGSGPHLKSRRITATLRKTARKRQQQGAESAITPSWSRD